MTSLPSNTIARCRSRVILCALPFALTSLLAFSPVIDAAEAAPGLEITSCTVFSEQDESLAHDCASEARKLCPGPGTCELPIGLNLTEGKDLDNNPDTWELVRVEFSCRDVARINGPHYQNDHATMTLACQR